MNLVLVWVWHSCFVSYLLQQNYAYRRAKRFLTILQSFWRYVYDEYWRWTVDGRGANEVLFFGESESTSDKNVIWDYHLGEGKITFSTWNWVRNTSPSRWKWWTNHLALSRYDEPARNQERFHCRWIDRRHFRPLFYEMMLFWLIQWWIDWKYRSMSLW